MIISFNHSLMFQARSNISFAYSLGPQVGRNANGHGHKGAPLGGAARTRFVLAHVRMGLCRRLFKTRAAAKVGAQPVPARAGLCHAIAVHKGGACPVPSVNKQGLNVGSADGSRVGSHMSRTEPHITRCLSTLGLAPTRLM